jgi:hypothetical protein
MEWSKVRTTNCWLVNIWECPKSNKYKTNCSNSCLFVWNRTQNSIYCKEIPFWYNVSRCRIRICWNIVIRVTLSFWIKTCQKSTSRSQAQNSHQVFRIKVREKIYPVRVCLNTQRVCRPVLMQCSKMYQTQCCL